MTYPSVEQRRAPGSIGERLIHARRKIGIVCVVSSLVFLLLLAFSSSFAFSSNPPPGQGGSQADSLALVTASIAAIGSCVTMVTTFVTFLSATLLAWAKDRREGRAVDLENQRKALELQRERWKLEQERKNAQER